MAIETETEAIEQNVSATHEAEENILPEKTKPQSGRWVGRIYAVLGLVLFLGIGLTIGAFIRFSEDVASLKAPGDNIKYDAIVVLTGGPNRITQAVRMLEGGVAGKLFISGVNANIPDREIQRVSSASKDLFECCIEVGRQAMDTFGNGVEIANWAKANEFRKLAVVTSNYHMLRSLYELRLVDNNLEYTAFPVATVDIRDFKWATNPEVLRALIHEFVKLNAAHFRNL